jgi:hypothetical protein
MNVIMPVCDLCLLLCVRVLNACIYLVYLFIYIRMRARNVFVLFSLFRNAVFWDVVPWRYCINRRFGGTYRLHLTTCSRWFLARGFFFFSSTLKMEAIRFPKRRFIQYLHYATSQKTAFFIVTAAKTSNFTYFLLCLRFSFM